MSRDFFDPTPEEQDVVLIDAATLHEAELLIESCEHCNPDYESGQFASPNSVIRKGEIPARNAIRLVPKP